MSIYCPRRPPVIRNLNFLISYSNIIKNVAILQMMNDDSMSREDSKQPKTFT